MSYALPEKNPSILPPVEENLGVVGQVLSPSDTEQVFSTYSPEGIIKQEQVVEENEAALALLDDYFTEHGERGSLSQELLDLAEGYGRNHPLDRSMVDALIANVHPRIENGDQFTWSLIDTPNSFGVRKDEFGIADFYLQSLIRPVTPSTVNELLMVMREIPASTQERMESNRADALRLAVPFGGLREFIHDEHPGVHEVVAAMVAYCKTGDSAPLVAAMDKSDFFKSNDTDMQRMLDPTNYTKQMEQRFGNPDEQVLTILERLESNTRPVSEEPPEVDDTTLAGLLAETYAASSREKKATVHSATLYLNQLLEEMMDQQRVGIEPSIVIAIAWVDREQFKVLQSLDYEDQIRLPRQQWFADLLRFQELTHNQDYAADDFNQFTESLKLMTDKEGFQSVAARVLKEVQNLAKAYTSRGKSRWTEALWSGNVTHELIGLVDARKPATAVGRRLLAGVVGE